VITRVQIRNFKQFTDVDIELGRNVVFIGPNNSGKTSALQALAAWAEGLQKWREKRSGKGSPEKRPGVTINRRDLIAIPVPSALMLWRDLHVRSASRENGKTQATKNIRIDVIVEGVTNGNSWTCGLEFDYANEESIYCRPLRTDGGNANSRFEIPPESYEVKVAFLPPMSGLAAIEPVLLRDRVNVLVGEGQTAQVLRNLCYQIYEKDPDGNWNKLAEIIENLFGVILMPPQIVPGRGEIVMYYKTPGGAQLDLSCSGRGMQQVLLLLSHLYANPGSVLLLDEPDAHLEVIRQREIYHLLSEVAAEQNSQIIAASHSEILLNEAAGTDIVIAFLGKPHRIGGRGSQLRKSLMEIGYDKYVQALQKGWVLYLEGSTDLAILRTLAKKLEHPAWNLLQRPFVDYVENHPDQARHRFWGLKEAKSDLSGIAIFDRIATVLQGGEELVERMWSRREIENFICQKEVLIKYAQSVEPGITQSASSGLVFDESINGGKRAEVMESCIGELCEALSKLKKPSPWSPDLKVTDEFLDLLFENYYKKLGLPCMMRKSNYHLLAEHMTPAMIDPEIKDMLDLICEVAQRANPEGD